jgi:DMATS type aromatic prenyltransferase
MATYGEVSSLQIQQLCQALGLAGAPHYQTVQAFLMASWSERQVPLLAPYPSRIGDDHSPYEYSVQFSRSSVELRLLVEAQAAVPSLSANQLAAEALNSALSARFGLDLTRLSAVKDLFLPTDPQGPFSLWHAACFDSRARPDFKLYLNPQVHSGVSGLALVSEAVDRIGLSGVAKSVMAQVAALGGEPNYFSLDLADRLGSRVKLYFSHSDVTPSELEKILALAPSNHVGDITHFCQSILGHTRRLTKKPVCYCFSFVAGVNTPVAVTFHLPVAHYRDSDAEVMHHVSAFMAQHALPEAQYRSAVAGFSRRPLAAGVGVQSYASYRREPSGLKLTVYLSPELFAAPYSQFPYSFEHEDLGSAE